MNSDMEDAIKIPKKYLVMAGFWVFDHDSIFIKLRRLTIITMSFFMTFFGIVDTLKYLEDFKQIAEHLSLTSTMFSFVLKISIFQYNNGKLKALLKHMQLPILRSYSNQFDHHLQSTIKITTRLGRIYQFLCLTVIVLYSLLPQFSNFDLPFYFPLELHGISKACVYAFQLVTLGFSACLNCSLDLLASFLMCTVAAQVKICNEQIRVCQENGSDSKTALNLKKCAQHHYTVIK